MALKKDGDKKPVNVNLEDDDYKIIKIMAAIKGKSATSLVRVIINDFLESYKGEF